MHFPSPFIVLLAAASTVATSQDLRPAARQAPQMVPVVRAPTDPKDPSSPPPAMTFRASKDATCSPRSAPFVTQIHAGGGSDRVWAGDADAQLFGEADADFIAGGRGEDEIHGGTEADVLVGGAGADRFVLKSTDDSAVDEDGSWSPLSGDTIVDYTTPDRDRSICASGQAGRNAPATFDGVRARTPYELAQPGRRPRSSSSTPRGRGGRHGGQPDRASHFARQLLRSEPTRRMIKGTKAPQTTKRGSFG